MVILESRISLSVNLQHSTAQHSSSTALHVGSKWQRREHLPGTQSYPGSYLELIIHTRQPCIHWNPFCHPNHVSWKVLSVNVVGLITYIEDDFHRWKIPRSYSSDGFNHTFPALNSFAEEQRASSKYQRWHKTFCGFSGSSICGQVLIRVALFHTQVSKGDKWE